MSVQVPVALHQSERTSSPSNGKPSLFKWVSSTELLFVLLACSVVAVLLRTQDKLNFSPVWNDTLTTEVYLNKRFPTDKEKIPLPVVTDLNSDGLTDIVMVTPDHYLRKYSAEPKPSRMGPSDIYKYKATNVSLAKDQLFSGKVVAVATGFIDPYSSMVQVREQVIVVLTSSWYVGCYSYKLRLKWSKIITDFNQIPIVGEAAILVSPAAIKAGDKSGSVIVGGRIDLQSGHAASEDSFTRKRRGEREEDYEQDFLKSLAHYSTYALDAKRGDLRWKHEPGDFEQQPAYVDSVSSFHHIKLILHGSMYHQGEVSWHQYSNAVLDVLPHSWNKNSDTFMELAEFRKDRKKTDKPHVTEHLSKVGDMAVDHIAGYAFGGLRPHSSDEHIPNPNVLVIHSMKGLEVLNLESGRPVFSLPLSPTHAVHGDINSDGVIDHVHAVVNPGEEYRPGEKISKHDDIECYGVATPFNAGGKIFKHSICKATHWTEAFIATEQWLPQLTSAGRKPVDHGLTEPYSPLLVPSASHQHPLKLTSLRRNDSFEMGVVYDSIFLLSSGRVTSIGPAGQFNWQVDVESDWDIATEVLYNPNSKQSMETVEFSAKSFTPSFLKFPLKSFDTESHVLVVGWSHATILNTLDGTTAAKFRLPCHPVLGAVVADFTGDGVNDVIVVCSDRVVGFSPVHQSGFWRSTALSLFVGLVLVIVAVYTRQHTGFLMPRNKTATD